jgi:type I restriction enzyme M protein
VTDNLHAITRENPDLNGVIDRRDFNATEGNQRLLDDNTLASLLNILSEQRLGLGDVQPDIIGRAYEYLIRKFAEKGSSAGEFFTPTGVGFLLAYILDPEDGDELDDPAAGSAGLLIKFALRHRAKNDADAPLPLEEALVLLAEAEEARSAADARLQVLAALGLCDRPGFAEKPS